MSSTTNNSWLVPVLLGMLSLVGVLATVFVTRARNRLLTPAERDKLMVEIAEKAAEAANDAYERSEKERQLLATKLELAETSMKERVGQLANHIRRLEQQLRDSQSIVRQQAYNSLLATLPDAVIQAGKDGLISAVNARAESLFGYKAGEMIGCPLTSMMPERYRAEHREHFEHAVVTGTGKLLARTSPVFVQGLRKDGTEIEIALTLGTDGNIFTTIIRPWVERK